MQVKNRIQVDLWPQTLRALKARQLEYRKAKVKVPSVPTLLNHFVLRGVMEDFDPIIPPHPAENQKKKVKSNGHD